MDTTISPSHNRPLFNPNIDVDIEIPQPAYVQGRSKIMPTALTRCTNSSATNAGASTNASTPGASVGSTIQFDNEMAFAISCIRRIREHAPMVRKVKDEQRKHLSLVDGIALLLVTDEKADVAAVSFLQTPTSIDFYYAKNSPGAVSERYIESLLDLIRTYDPSKRAQYALRITEMAASMCIRKVRNRIRKIERELAKSGVTISTLKLGNLGNLQIRETAEHPISKAIADAYPEYSPSESTREGQILNEPDNKILARYFHIVLRMSVSVEALRKELDGVLELLMISFSVGMMSLSSFMRRTSSRI
jgi:hypothetical protein